MKLLNKIKSGFNMLKSFKHSKIVLISLACFCASFALTAAVTKTVKTINMHKGVGGFETANVPEYSENLDHLLSDSEAADAVPEGDSSASADDQRRKSGSGMRPGRRSKRRPRKESRLRPVEQFWLRRTQRNVDFQTVYGLN